MTWQDELQKLDNELASGRISADDYRRRRDEVLSGSAGGGPAQNPQGGPFAPPFKWEAQPPSTSDRTQVVNVQGAPQQQPPQPQQNPNPDATQVVAGGQRGGGDADRTQFVAPVQPQQGGWGQQPQQAAPPPWVGGDFDQINQPSPSWSHGPEVFDDSSGGGKGKIFAIVGVVLVLALIGGGIWWFTAGSKSGGDNVATSNTTPPPTTSSSAGPKLPLNGLQGKVDSANTGPVTVDKASKEKSQFSPDEAALLTTCGAEEGMSQVLFADDWFTQVHIFSCTDGATAKTAADALAELQKGYGFAATTGPKQLPSMVSEKATDVPDAPFDSRIFYVSEKSVVRVEVRGKTKAAMDTGAEKVVTAIDKNYPAK
ncbi:hypothetical protein [Lentzea sp. E54]|uniref:hypothetical protein n=1 Tax=Lentzea xerophila TaxID=3435883 RepID=UPI003DA1DD2E